MGSVLCWVLFSSRVLTSWTGSPSRVSLWRYSSRPFSIRIAFTTSLTRGAVRYFVFDFRSLFSVSLAILWARSVGMFVSFMRESVILLMSNSSSARRDVRTSSLLGLRVFFRISSATLITIFPSSVRRYLFDSMSVSIRFVLSRDFRW